MPIIIDLGDETQTGPGNWLTHWVNQQKAKAKPVIQNPHHKLTSATIAKAQRKSNVDRLLESIDLMPDDVTYSHFADLFESVIKQSAARAIRNINLDISVDDIDEDMLRQMAEDRVDNFFAQINATTENQIRRAVEDGISQDDSTDELISRIQDVIESRANNAWNMAQTQTNGLSNFGALSAYDEAGVEANGWGTMQDERVRDSHAEIEGEEVPVGAQFSIGVAYPGDPSGDISEIANCRCFLYPVTKSRGKLYTAEIEKSHDDALDVNTRRIAIAVKKVIRGQIKLIRLR